MTKFEELQEQRKTLRKDVNSVIQYNVLTLLVGELETLSKRTGKPVMDTDVTAGVKKLLKSNTETIKIVEASGGNVSKWETENEFLETLVPLELTKEQLYDILVEVVFSNIGEGMAFLNTNYPNKFDRKTASEVIRSIL